MELLCFKEFFDKQYFIEAFDWTDPVTGKVYSAMNAPLNNVKLEPVDGDTLVYKFESKPTMQKIMFGNQELNVNQPDYYESQFQKLDFRVVASLLEPLILAADQSLDANDKKEERKKYLQIFHNAIGNSYKVDLHSEASKFFPKLGSFEESDPMFVYSNLMVGVRKLLEQEDVGGLFLDPYQDHPKLITLYHSLYKYYIKRQFMYVGSEFYIRRDKLDKAFRMLNSINYELSEKIFNVLEKLDKHKDLFVSQVRQEKENIRQKRKLKI